MTTMGDRCKAGHAWPLDRKVFCIGMNKTGTSTIKHCFDTLGLHPIASPKTYGSLIRDRIRNFYRHRNYEDMLALADAYLSFEDRPWNMWSMYRHLRERFPDGRFILTVRDAESWWRSTERWLTVTKPEVLPRYQLHLRVDDLNRESMIESYLRYNDEVQDFFAGSRQLLVLDLERGDGWEKLCRFLALPIPPVPFPHANQQHYTADDARMLREKRKLKHGIVCQACAHVTPLRTSRGEGRAPATEPRLRNGRLLRRFSPRFDPQRLQNSLTARRALYLTRRALDLLPAARAARRVVAPARLAKDEFAVVACLFDPGHSPRRVANFRRFLAGIRSNGVRCIAVELAYGSNPFRVDDHPDVIRLRSHSVLWHKERLLNIGIRRLLEEGVRKIAWLDGDIAFEEANWPLEVVRRLDDAKLCQVFDTVAIHAHPHGPPMVAPSAVRYFRETGEIFDQHPRKVANLARGLLKGGQSGFGWAARAEVLKRSLLFEHAVVGGGDKLMLAASLADPRDGRIGKLSRSRIPCRACGHRNGSAAFSEDFERWAAGWSEAVTGSVNHARLRIRDMYHGRRSDRGYATRHDILYRHGFDPRRDLIPNESGALEWRPGREELQHAVEGYFLSRREDL